MSGNNSNECRGGCSILISRALRISISAQSFLLIWVLLAIIAFSSGQYSLSHAGDLQLITIDADDPPKHILRGNEVKHIENLHKTWKVRFDSPLNPGGNTIIAEVVHPEEGGGSGFWNFHQDTFVSVNETSKEILETAWINAEYLGVILRDPQNSTLHMGIADANTGRLLIEESPLPVNGQVLAFSPDATKLLLLVPYEDADLFRSGRKTRSSEVKTIKIPTGFSSSGGQKFVEVTAEDSVLMLFDLNSNISHQLQILESTSQLPQSSFSPDGTSLIVVHNFFEDTMPNIVRPGGIVQSLTMIMVQDALGNIDPQENPYHTNSSVMLFDVENPDNLPPMILSSADVPGNYPRFSNNYPPEWSPSGDKVVFAVETPSSIQGREMPIYAKTESMRYLIYNRQLELTAEIDSAPLNYPSATYDFSWLSDNEAVFIVQEEMDEGVYKFDVAEQSLARLYHSGRIGPYFLVPNERFLFMMRDSADKASELWRLHLDSGEAIQLTEMNSGITSQAGVAARQVEFTLNSGEVRKGYWFAPESMSWPPRNQPVVLWQRGGPGGNMVNQWGVSVEGPMTLLPSMGISVLMVPLQQRPGFETAMWNQLADGHNFGKVDIDELAEIARQITERGWASPGGPGISGCSYGGYMSAQSIVLHPDVYAAANPQCSLLDLVTEFQMGYPRHIAYLTGSVPWQNWAHYITASPGFFGFEVKTPTLIFHGVDDFLPVGITENFFHDIHKAGTDARMLRFVGEGHGLRRNPNQIYAAQEQISWFRKYLR